MVRADDDRHRGLRLLLVGLAGPGAVTKRMYVGVCPSGESQLTYVVPIALTAEFALDGGLR